MEIPPQTLSETSARNARLGIRLFWVYLFFYVSFVLANTFAPEKMEATPFAGINLAILGGLGLIFAALAMAFAYGWACRGAAKERKEKSP